MNKGQLTIQELQQRIRQNKMNKGLPIDNLAIDIAWIHEELGELARAHRRSREKEFIGELVDISIFILGVFAMLDLSGYELLLKKMKMNEQSRYKKRGKFNIRSDEKRERETLHIIRIDKEELEKEPTIKEIQKRIWQNKIDKEFSTNNIEHDLICMLEEAGEVAWACRMGLDKKLIDAVVDLLIYAWGLFEMKGVDGYKEILRKMQINETRDYKQNGKIITRADFTWK